MDRVIVYDGALPQTTDVLLTNKFAMVDQAYQNRAIMGVNTAVSGLACTPTSPTADLHVTVGVGSIYQSLSPDATAYGDLGTDTAIPIIKQGILGTPVVLTITPPVTPGQSQVYLVQAIASDVDGGSTVLSYYNSSNPAAPYSGPANSGASNFTVRTCPCSIALVAGTPATTGTQVTPPPQAGYVGLYAVTVANGQTQITGGNIVTYPLALFIPPLTTVPNQVQAGTWVYCQDTGAANALIVTPTPNIAALTVGLGLRVKVAVSNTTTSTITINYTNTSGTASTFGPIAIKRGSTAALASGDLIAGAVIDIIYDGTNFQMMNYIGSTGSNTSNVTQVGLPYIADTGAQNAIVATFSPSIGAYTAGVAVAVKLAFTITGACTINANGLGVKAIKLGDLTIPPYNVFTAGMVIVLEYDGTQFQIVNTSAGMFAKRPTANYTIYVNTSTGDDSLYDGTSASVVGGGSSAGPLKTIQKGLNVAFGYAASNFTITVQVAAGTYAENITTPLWAGPNVTINGAGIGSTIINGASGTSIFATVVSQGPNTLNVTNCTVQNTGTYPTHGFFAQAGSTLTTNNCATGATGGGNFACSFGATIYPGTHTFSGGGIAAFWVENGGTVAVLSNASVTWTISTPISYSQAFANIGTGGSFYIYTSSNVSFVNPGFVSAVKYNAHYNGTISVGGGGFNYLPGSLAGVTSNGGFYIP